MKSVMTSRNFDPPEEVLEEILSWVPPEPLIQFKCVSKSWYALINSLIKDSAFVNKHLHNMLANRFSSTGSFFICFPCFNYSSRSKYPFDQVSVLSLFIDEVANGRGNSVGGQRFSPVLPPGMLGLPFRVCHCNGIICIAADDVGIVLCNPAIKELRTLPNCVVHKDLVMEGMGFGYDSRANDYKVVRILIDRNDWIPRAILFSMKTGSWREIGFNLQFNHPFRYFIGPAVFCKGVVYWSLLNFKFGPVGIISFDMADDVFYSIPLPDDIGKQEGIKIAAWNGSVACISYPAKVLAAFVPIRVWMMDGSSNVVSGAYSWTKKQTIGPLERVATPWTFWKNDELLMEGDEGLVSYNLQTRMLRNIAIQGEERNPYDQGNGWVLPYVKSLVSVQGGEQTRARR